MEQLLYDVGDWLDTLGVWAYLLAPLLMACVAILPVPAEAPAMVNGALFGPLAGTAVTWLGSMLGATASFELARRFGRPVAERFLRPSAIDRADRFVVDAGWQGLLLARLIPFIAFTALNWGAGLTAVSRWRFAWTTGIGIAPAALVFTASGWGLSRLRSGLGWVAVGVATVLLFWWWWRGRSRSPFGSGPGEAPDGAPRSAPESE
ncbi:MAG: TVP38/TMEM64 family protein [Gemmatimonadota bacterium]|nr:TVP38/TMEM64 family protein [Gemmatimonadota bacterium]